MTSAEGYRRVIARVQIAHPIGGSAISPGEVSDLPVHMAEQLWRRGDVAFADCDQECAALEAELARLATSYGAGEISEGEWQAARSGFAQRLARETAERDAHLSDRRRDLDAHRERAAAELAAAQRTLEDHDQKTATRKGMN